LKHKIFKNISHAKQQQTSVDKKCHLQLKVSIYQFSTHFISKNLSERVRKSEKNMDFDQIRPK